MLEIPIRAEPIIRDIYCLETDEADVVAPINVKISIPAGAYSVVVVLRLV